MIEAVLLVFQVALSALYSLWIVAILLPRKPHDASFDPPVSVIIPAHNEETTIRKTIESVLSQDHAVDIIVVDDGSLDDTARIVEDIAADFKNVTLLRSGHRGKSAALNAALSKATRDVIVTLDADSDLMPGSLRAVVRPLSDGKIGAVAGVIRARKTMNPLTWFQDYEYIMQSGWRFASSNIDGNSIVPGFAAFRREALDKIGGFSSDTLTEDFDIVVSLRKAGYSTTTIRDACIITSVPDSMKSLTRQRLRWGSGALQVIAKHVGFVGSRDSGTMGCITIPTQFYWYIHAAVYLPIMIYMILYVWPSALASSHGYLSLEFARYLLMIFSVYGIVDLAVKVISREYALTYSIAMSLGSFMLSLIFTLATFAKIARPDARIVISYLFFFPYSLFNLSLLGVSAVKASLDPGRRNKWE